MKKKINVLCALFAFVPSMFFAQNSAKDTIKSLQEVVISDTKFAQSKEKSGKVITKISAADLERKVGQSLPMILNSLAGVEINGGQSANGKNLGYYIRGGKNQQVLILIDGSPATDASGISIEFDLRLIAIDQIESIEIMKGASSTLYGTGAATAVINITLKKSSKKTLKGSVNMAIGSNTTAKDSNLKGHDIQQSIALDGSSGNYNYLFSLNSVETNGMSQIASWINQNNEWDRFSKINLRGGFGIKYSPNFSTNFFATYDQIKNDYDAPFDNTGNNDTPLNVTSSFQTKFGLLSKFKYNAGEAILNASFSDVKREYTENNFWANSIDNSSYGSRNVHLDLVNKNKFSPYFYLITGANYQFFDMNSQTPYSNISEKTTKFNLLDFYATAVCNTNFGLQLQTGLRLNTHSQYGLKTVYNINPSFHFGDQKQHKILSSFSTAFVTPSLYQLYSEYGNSNLTPEQNETFELGFETFSNSKKLQFNLVTFLRNQSNSFGFYTDSITFQSNYINIDGKSTAKGIETEWKYILNKKITYQFNYTFTEVDENLNRLIPKHKINASLDYFATQKLFLNLSYQYTSARQDFYFDGISYQTVASNLKDFQLVHFTSTYDILPNRFSIFATVQNVFNTDFVENIGYASRGRNLKLGLNFKF